jgi:hypothetical protein
MLEIICQTTAHVCVRKRYDLRFKNKGRMWCPAVLPLVNLKSYFLNLGFLLILGTLFIPYPAKASVIIQAPLYIGLTNGLVGNWTFDGPTVSGTDPMKVNDLSGNGNQGSASGSNIPMRTAGKIDQALSFNGLNQCVTAANASFDALSDKAISVWLNVRSYPGRKSGVLGRALVTRARAQRSPLRAVPASMAFPCTPTPISRRIAETSWSA